MKSIDSQASQEHRDKRAEGKYEITSVGSDSGD